MNIQFGMFRGQSKSTEEFVFGWYRKENDKCIISSEEIGDVEIVKGSQDLYTGISDTQGIPIFENDVVKYEFSKVDDGNLVQYGTVRNGGEHRQVPMFFIGSSPMHWNLISKGIKVVGIYTKCNGIKMLKYKKLFGLKDELDGLIDNFAKIVDLYERQQITGESIEFAYKSIGSIIKQYSFQNVNKIQFRGGLNE